MRFSPRCRRLLLLDEDLADIFGGTTKRLNEQVQPNRDRFPDDFMFTLSPEEFANLRSPVLLKKKYDKQFQVVFDAIRQLMAPDASKQSRIGFEQFRDAMTS